MKFLIPRPRERNGATRCRGYTPDMVDWHPALRGRHGWKLIWMRPAKFLAVVDPRFSPRPESLKFIAARIDEGECFAPLQIWPRRRVTSWALQHEGRHRAFIAAQRGVERVPVLVWPDARSRGERRERMRARRARRRMKP